jgi:hypothetical protein
MGFKHGLNISKHELASPAKPQKVVIVPPIDWVIIIILDPFFEMG